MTYRIPLSRGIYCRVDLADFLEFGQLRWNAGQNLNGYTYAVRRHEGRKQLLHRLIAAPGKGKIVDHKNGDTLDNRRANLRVCTRSQNCMNKKVSSAAGLPRGVAFRPDGSMSNPWQVRITAARNRIFLGCFPSVEAALRARRAAEKKYFGEFSYANSRR